MTLKFGTSGIRGLVSELTDYEVYLFTIAFIRYVNTKFSFKKVCIAGDLRSSTPRIIKAVVFAVNNFGCVPDFCGFIPTPALMLHGIKNNSPSIMVTGSHIPDDRNGIKFNLPCGEVLKSDEQEIVKIYNELKKELMDKKDFFNAYFNQHLYFKDEIEIIIPEINKNVKIDYINRYISFFEKKTLSGLNIAVYQHSTVARDILCELLTELGANVIKTGYSDKFIPVDTEAVENLEMLSEFVKKNNADALVSSDGDGDRPLVISDKGEFIQGDLLGILASSFLKVDFIATPISSNTAVEKSNLFKKVVFTKIGSPYVINAMNEAEEKTFSIIAGYEANGGYLTKSDIVSCFTGQTLQALPTRDAVLPILCILAMAKKSDKKISELSSELPARYTYSGILRNFANEKGKSIIELLINGGIEKAGQLFNELDKIKYIDSTDGCRITFNNGDIAHLRPSGNAPEFRCYTESSDFATAKKLNEKVLNIINTIISFVQ